MKPQFITAIYTDLEGTRFNGNTSAIYERYQESLLSIAKGGYNIVCYTAQAHYPELKEKYADYPNVKLIVQELNEHPYHERIEAIKDIDPRYTSETSWRSRCVEIMWGKFFWLKDTLRELDDSDALFWIDAGIFHGGLFPDKFMSDKSSSPFDFDLITQDRNLFEDLVNYTGDKILNIKSIWVNHGQDDYVKVFKTGADYGVIGGVFGGRKQLLEEYITQMIELMEATLDTQVLLKEEELMYRLNSMTPSKFTDFTFNSWYHEGWADIHEDTDICLSDFFEVIRGRT